MSTDPNEAAQSLLQNSHFLELFQRTLATSSGKDGGSATLEEALHDIPAEGDPAREAWLRKLQDSIHHEMLKDASADLEQVHTDDKGQWMYILPRPGFCIKCTTAGGGKVFINVSQHERIAEPMPLPASSSSKAIPSSSGSAHTPPEEEEEIQFRIPLSCGQARLEKDKAGRSCKVYDVIVNPATVDRCGRESDFRRFVAALCMEWIRQKSEPTLNAKEFRNLNFRVKGTLEPQRIRLSHTAPPANAMNDEIRLPVTESAPSAPSPAGGVTMSRKLIEEIATPETVQQSSSVYDSCGSATANSNSNRHADKGSSSNRNKTDGRGKECTTGSAGTPSHTAARPNDAADKNHNSMSNASSTVSVTAEGNYDWSRHPQPTASPFFREAVPQSYAVVLHLPDVQTIRDVDVRLSSRRLECYHVDCDDENEGVTNSARETANDTTMKTMHNAREEQSLSERTPFLVVRFDYPVGETVYDAKFVKKTALLRLRCRVQLPDERGEARTQPDRDAAEEEAEALQCAEAERQAAWQETQQRQARIAAEESTIHNERRRLVEGLAAVQSGAVPQELRDEFDAMPREQLPVLLQRLEGRVRRDDSVDRLLETLPEVALAGLCAYIREKLSLEPRERSAVSAVSGAIDREALGSTYTPSSTREQEEQLTSDSHASSDAVTSSSAVPVPSRNSGSQDVNEYNSMKKSELLFGLELRNRYVFALDS